MIEIGGAAELIPETAHNDKDGASRDIEPKFLAGRVPTKRYDSKRCITRQ